MALNPDRIRPRERDAIVQSLRAGVVPRVGQHHIQVGRADEVAALMSDIDTIADGGAAARFVIGEYGAGKSFFLNLVRAIALRKDLVTVNADLAPQIRLHSSTGQARALYAALMQSASTRSSPTGGAVEAIVERFIEEAVNSVGGTEAKVDDAIRAKLSEMRALTGGYDFADVVAAYWRGHLMARDGNVDEGADLKDAALRWMRGEYSTRTDARAALGVRAIVDDNGFYDHLKLFACFVRLAGFAGLLVCLDEMVTLYRLANTRARKGNYEQVLRVLNDCLQGSASRVGFVFGCTPEMLMDTRRGLYSDPALQSRLAENTFAAGGLVDRSGPVLRLAGLTPEDVYVLLGKLRHVYAAGDSDRYLLPDEAIEAFMHHCSSRIGDAYFRTPRSTIREFINLLAVLEQNPNTSWESLIGGVQITRDTDTAAGLTVHEPENTGISPQGDALPGASGHDAASPDDELTDLRLG